MPVVTDSNPFNFLVPLLDYTIVILLSFYALFALLIMRQVDLMSKALITPVSPFIKAFSIIHAGFALGLILLAIGLL